MKKPVENLIKRKASGGRRRTLRSRRKYETDRYPNEPILGKHQIVVRRVRGHNLKSAVKAVEFANVVDPTSGKVLKTPIKAVAHNPSNKDYERRGVVTKGAIIETESGTARVLSRPGQDGTVNAVLVK
ncbi:MAG: 30S ribosomal protein S8e [Nitrososphaerales archaeon]